MPDAQPLPDALDGRPFSVADAAASGVPAKRLRAKDLVAPFHGVRMPARLAGDFEARCRAYASRAGAAHCFTHATAARIWAIPLPTRLEHDERLHVLYRDAHRAPRGVGVIGHKSASPVTIVEVGGLRVTDPIATWFSLASTLSHVELVAAGDRLVGWRSPLVMLEEMAVAVAAHVGVRGARRIRAAFADVRPGSASPRETRVRLALDAAHLPQPVLNAPIELGDRTIHGDLVYPRWRVMLEYDSDFHRVDDGQWAIDLGRYNALSAAGWIVVRISKHVSDADVVTATRDALRLRGAL